MRIIQWKRVFLLTNDNDIRSGYRHDKCHAMDFLWGNTVDSAVLLIIFVDGVLIGRYQNLADVYGDENDYRLFLLLFQGADAPSQHRP